MLKTNYYFRLVGLLLAVWLMTACGVGGPPPDPEGAYEWCYTFNFEDDDYDADVLAGDWIEGEGFRTSTDLMPADPSGELHIRYVHSEFVEPASVVIYLNFFHNMFLPIDEDSQLTGQATFFGITGGSFSAAVPTSIDTQEVEIRPDAAGIAGTLAEVQIESNARVTISGVTVSGYGSNPFPSNGCSIPSTPTGTPFVFPSLTPTGTLTPTSSPPPTATNTPTVTPTPDTTDWVCTFDFSLGNGGWQKYQANSASIGTYIGGATGWQSQFADILSGNASRLYLEREFAAAYITGVDVTHQRPTVTGGLRTIWTESGGVTTQHFDEVNATSYPSGTVLSSPINILADTIVVRMNTSPQNVDIRYTQIVVSGAGSTPFTETTGITCDDDAPTPTVTPTPDDDATATAVSEQTSTESANGTATAGAQGTATALATITPTATHTPSVSEQCGFVNYTFNSGLDEWDTTGSVSAAVGAAILGHEGAISQTLELEAGDYFLALSSSIDDAGSSPSDGGVAFIYSINEDDESTTGRAESSYYQLGNQISTTVAVNIATPGTYDISIAADLTNVNAIKLLSACFTPTVPGEINDDNENNDNESDGSWQTCGDQISPPTSIIEIGGWITYLWESTDQTVQCTIMPPIYLVAGVVMGTIHWFGTSFIPFILGHLGNFFEVLKYIIENGIGGFILQITTTLEQLASWVGMVGSIVVANAETAKAYMGVFQYQMDAIVNNWNNAPYTPPPGLPDCISAPLEYEICAVWWVMENTFFYGTVGQILVPIVCVFIDILIVFYFGNMVKRFVVAVVKMLGG